MKFKKSFKTRFAISRFLGILAVIFCVAETSFFLIKDGYHVAANSKAEHICDTITNWLITISFIFFISVLYDIAKLFSNADITEINIQEKK